MWLNGIAMLRHRLRVLKIFLSTMKSSIDALGICETFLSMDSCLSSYIFPGYQMISKVRNRMRQGGLSFLLKNGIKFEERDDLCLWIEGKVEIFFVEIVFDENKKIVICLVYKPPSTPRLSSLIYLMIIYVNFCL